MRIFSSIRTKKDFLQHEHSLSLLNLYNKYLTRSLKVLLNDRNKLKCAFSALSEPNRTFYNPNTPYCIKPRYYMILNKTHSVPSLLGQYEMICNVMHTCIDRCIKPSYLHSTSIPKIRWEFSLITCEQRQVVFRFEARFLWFYRHVGGAGHFQYRPPFVERPKLLLAVPCDNATIIIHRYYTPLTQNQTTQKPIIQIFINDE
jgi:hypothetical protein